MLSFNLKPARRVVAKPFVFGLLPIIVSCLALSSCARHESQAGVRGVAGADARAPETEWQAKDLAAGPTSLVKAPLAALICPLRLTSKTFVGISDSSTGAESTAAELFLWPVRAIVDGVATGVGYALGGAIDTVTGGIAGVVENATEEEQPNTNLYCVLAGESQS